MYINCPFPATWCSILRANKICGDSATCVWYWYIYNIFAYLFVLYLLSRVACIISPTFRQRVWYVRISISTLGALIKVLGWESLRRLVTTKLQTFLLQKISSFSVIDDGLNVTISYYWAPTGKIYKILFPKTDTSNCSELYNISSNECKMTNLRDFIDCAGPYGDFHCTNLTPLDLGYTGSLIFTYKDGDSVRECILGQDDSLSSIITKLTLPVSEKVENKSD